MAGHTRRSILRTAAGAAAFGMSGARAEPATSVRLDPVEVAPGVFVAAGKHELITPGNGGHIANMSFIVGTQCVAVIDTGGSAGCGRALLKAVRAVSPLPVRYVINTHMHPDHVFGNGPFVGPETIFAGHAKLARALAARGERYLAVNQADLSPDDFAGTKIVAATLLVEGESRIDLGGRTLVLTARRTAHTDNDLTVRDDATNTLFLGDLLFAGHVPTLDGSIKGWLALMDDLRGEPAARVVPGHGPAWMPWPDAMSAEVHYLNGVADDVRMSIRAGKALDEAMRTAASSERANWLLFDDFHARNIAAAFAELEWE